MHTDQLAAVSAPEGDELVFYPEPSALRRGVLAGVAIIAVGSGFAWHLGHSAFPHPVWQVLAVGGCIVGVLLGAAVVASTLARYPRLRLVHNALIVEGPFREKVYDLSQLGSAHLVPFRFMHARQLYLAFLTHDEDQARRQVGVRRPLRMSEIHTSVLLGPFVGGNRAAARSIAHVINDRRPKAIARSQPQVEVQLNLRAIWRRRLVFAGIMILAVIAYAFGKAFLD